MTSNNRRILVTGGGTFLGDNIAAALLAEGAEVTLLVRPGHEERLGPLRQRVRWLTADVWDSASLRGRARGHGVVIHTVGSLTENPQQGLTFHRLNFVSTRNVAAMCVSDGVPSMVLLSSARAPWFSRGYLRSKREAEAYLQRVGVRGIVIRAPLTYPRGGKRPIFFELMTLFASVPPLAWTPLGRIAPMPVDVLARGTARIALAADRGPTIYYARELRRRNSRQEASGQAKPSGSGPSLTPTQVNAFELLDDDTPFGWLPPEDPSRS
jgi:uncharacterized protein YbjT (DUF2867 family)